MKKKKKKKKGNAPIGKAKESIFMANNKQENKKRKILFKSTGNIPLIILFYVISLIHFEI